MPPSDPSPGSRAVPCRRWGDGRFASGDDAIAVEEPLELRVNGVAVATVMRTPGSDRNLALGFFLSEGWVSSQTDVGVLAVCVSVAREENVADLIAAGGALLRSPTESRRLLPAVTSCGVCGKRTIEEVLSLTPLGKASGEAAMPAAGFHIPPETLLGLPPTLRGRQRLFRETGALHAAGIFDEGGGLLTIEEDVGRHNAVDKVLGWAFLAGRLPLSACALQVSGRVSFEIVQKAYRAGVPLVAAVSGASSLAIELADRAGITLVGFVRPRSLNVYTHPDRVHA